MKIKNKLQEKKQKQLQTEYKKLNKNPEVNKNKVKSNKRGNLKNFFEGEKLKEKPKSGEMSCGEILLIKYS
ncbi:MAG: hypothetical protein Q9M97_01305 [Candidatus Gracilibacteria bacterium]|nr:hypothetical protein [Candidatus Gracilibacteria bacterium]